MIDTIKRLFGLGPAVNYSELMQQGAIIIDVRSKGEFSNGHIPGSLNIPLEQIPSKSASFKDKNKPIITCCASGMRSASAKGILKAKGFTEVYNGGGWFSLQSKLHPED